MDVNGKSFYLVATPVYHNPMSTKKEANSGAFGPRIECERICVPCFAYKWEEVNGLVQSAVLTQYKDEQAKKRLELAP